MAKKRKLSAPKSARSPRISRRGFLGSAAGLAAAAATGGAGIVLEPLAGGSKARAADIGVPRTARLRARRFSCGHIAYSARRIDHAQARTIHRLIGQPTAQNASSL